MSTEEQAAKAIPAEVHMISGCKDEQTSAVSRCVVVFLVCFRRIEKVQDSSLTLLFPLANTVSLLFLRSGC